MKLPHNIRRRAALTINAEKIEFMRTLQTAVCFVGFCAIWLASYTFLNWIVWKIFWRTTETCRKIRVSKWTELVCCIIENFVWNEFKVLEICHQVRIFLHIFKQWPLYWLTVRKKKLTFTENVEPILPRALKRVKSDRKNIPPKNGRNL